MPRFYGGGGALASDSVPSEAILAFGLLKTYSTDHPVIMRADGDPYYSNVTKMVCIDLSLAAKLKSSYSGTLPYGTLTDLASNARYILYPNEPFLWAGNISLYDVQGLDFSDLVGHKVMWNVYTSPNVIVGAAQIPENLSQSTITLDDEAIVPYVKINYGNDSSFIERVDLYFVKLSDTATPVALGDTSVNVYLNSSSTDGSYPDFQFTNFNKAVRNSFNLYCDEDGLSSLTVEYIKDGAKYIWNFVPQYHDVSSIEWGGLDLEDQPLTLNAGASKKITVSLPGTQDLSSYFTGSGSDSDFVSVGNGAVLEVESGSFSFEQGSASWDGLNYSEKKSTLSFTLKGIASGRTTLQINIPNYGMCYREVHVLNDQGSLELSGEPPAGASIKIGGHTTFAAFVNGRPWYPSAEDVEMTYSFVLSGNDLPNSGYFGMTNEKASELHDMYVMQSSGSSKIYSIQNGIIFDPDQSFYTEDYVLSITEDDIENASVWAEFPDNPSFNVVSASLKSLMVESDYMTTAEQLENFAPYFRMYNLNEENSTVSLEWYFVNPKTMQKVTPDVSNVRVNYNDVNGTSGTISSTHSWYVNFQYDYNGVTYTWNFSEMTHGDYGSISLSSLKPGESTNVTVDLSNSYEQLASVDVSIWDTDILSADTVSFAAAKEISFTARGLKEGTTRIALVFTLKDSSSSCYQNHTNVTVSSAAASTVTTVTTDLTPSFRAEVGSGAVIEGATDTYGFRDEVTSVYVDLYSKATFSRDYYYEHYEQIQENKHGSVSIYSETDTLLTQEITFDYNEATGVLEFHSSEPVDYSKITRIEWEASDELITDGSINSVSQLTSPSSFSFQPRIKLNREGLNVSTLEYYFVDNDGSKISTPSGVSALSVKVTTHCGPVFYNEDQSGTMSVNMPEKALNVVDFAFTYNGIAYTSDFQFVSNNNPDSFKLEWTMGENNKDNPALPLFMTVGESRELTLSTGGENVTLKPYIGSSAIVSMDDLGTKDGAIQLRLTAIAAGMTSLTIVDGNDSSSTSIPREIWVADANGNIPHLNGTSADIYAQLTSDDLTSGSSSGWSETGDDSGSTTSGDVESGLETTDPVAVLAGLSVYPRYALPTDPSGDVCSQVWDNIYDNNLPYSAYMFEDEVEVLGSRDVTEVFKELSSDLISRKPAQILAVVLPEIEVQANGMYTFRIPTDNITPKGKKIFMHADNSDESGYFGEDDTGMNYYTDDGEELEYISGDEYINVAVYLNPGRYTPVITAKATSSDVDIINAAINPIPAALTLTASTVSMSITLSSDSTVTLTPGNAIGTVTYTANQSWVTFSENVATLRPTATGTYSVVITAMDSGGRTATVTITVTVTEASTTSDDVTPTESDDITPTESDDVTPTESDDITPTESDDINPPSAPASEDVNPPSTPVASEDVNPPSTPATSGDNTPGGDSSGGDSSGGITPVSGTTEAPSIDVSDTTVAERILNFFKTILSFITDDTEVEALSEENATVGTERSIDDMSDEERAAIPEDEEPAIILPIIRVQKPAVYVFGIDLSNLSVGARIFLYMMPQRDTTAAEFVAASDTEDAYTFLNDDGEEITTVPENKHANAAVYMEPDYTYAPVITVKESSSEGGDSSGGDSSGTDTTTGRVSSSGGGCDSGFSFMALAILGLLAKKRFVN